ncbi:MAG TPA: TIGR00730 family Rossman fold protein [Candidatus Paceibacterota bacterium]|nr:TIGR00730 family Rossman fold protein [Candidatus Paceibacterota bacterium]
MDEKNKQKPHYETLTLEKIDQALNKKIEVIEKEFRDGFDFIKKHEKSVTFFGSARNSDDDPDYINARKLASRISKETGYAIVTGGSGGIMEAANRGSFDVGGESLGLNIKLPQEQNANPYITAGMEFEYFFSRKVCLSFSAEAYVYFPGGFGTLDELFEILTLVQTGKIEPVPVLLVGSYFWNDLDKFIKEHLLKNKKIDQSDLDLYKITDNHDEIIELIKKAPIRSVIGSKK